MSMLKCPHCQKSVNLENGKLNEEIHRYILLTMETVYELKDKAHPIEWGYCKSERDIINLSKKLEKGYIVYAYTTNMNFHMKIIDKTVENVPQEIGYIYVTVGKK